MPVLFVASDDKAVAEVKALLPGVATDNGAASAGALANITAETAAALCEAVAPLGLAYLHIMRSPLADLDAFALARQHSRHSLILNDGFDGPSASAALDTLTDPERAAFQSLNADYVAKHGFPFIIAVRDNTKDSILAAFTTRIAHDTATEFATACAQVERIAELRLKDQLP